MVRLKRSSLGDPLKRPGPLTDQILRDRTATSSKRSTSIRDESPNDSICDSKLSERIVKIAKRQRKPEQDNDEKQPSANGICSKAILQESDTESEDEHQPNDYSCLDEEVNAPHVLQAFDNFFPPDDEARCTLASYMCRVSNEKTLELKNRLGTTGDGVVKDLDAEVLDMYRKVAKALSMYRSGRIPKAFKIIPKLANWEQILYLLEPEKWTNQAMYQATRIFASNMTSKMCERFYNIVLLPRIRDELTINKKLNPHLYQALIKSIYKPAAFFKGILLAICQDACTQREATVLGSVMNKISIPSLHAAAAMILLSREDYSPVTCYFIRILLEKKYTLPFKTIDSVVNFFVRFINSKQEMPVVWHQLLLSLVKNYKSDLASEQKEALLELIRGHSHPMITPEVRHEINTAVPRDIEDGPLPIPMEN